MDLVERDWLFGPVGARSVSLGERSRVRIPVYAHAGCCRCAESVSLGGYGRTDPLLKQALLSQCVGALRVLKGCWDEVGGWERETVLSTPIRRECVDRFRLGMGHLRAKAR
ncbi:unnamed protein product [Closterium sp. NIES-54]